MKGVLKRTVGGDRTFRILSESYLQSQVTAGNSTEYSDGLVCIVIDSWKSNFIGSEDGVW